MVAGLGTREGGWNSWWSRGRAVGASMDCVSENGKLTIANSIGSIIGWHESMITCFAEWLVWSAPILEQ